MTDRCEPPPEHRDRDGWHWLVWTPKGEAEPYNPTAIWWDSTVQDWCPDLPNTDAPRVLAQYRYLSPVAPPAAIAALRAERDALLVLAREAQRLGDEAVQEATNTATLLRNADVSNATLRAEVERLREALQNMMGAFNSPARRLKYPSPFGDAAIETARVAMLDGDKP